MDNEYDADMEYYGDFYGTEDHPINKDIEKANEESKVTEEVKQVVSAADRLKAMKAKVEYEMMLLGLRR